MSIRSLFPLSFWYALALISISLSHLGTLGCAVLGGLWSLNNTTQRCVYLLLVILACGSLRQRIANLEQQLATAQHRLQKRSKKPICGTVTAMRWYNNTLYLELYCQKEHCTLEIRTTRTSSCLPGDQITFRLPKKQLALERTYLLHKGIAARYATQRFSPRLIKRPTYAWSRVWYQTQRALHHAVAELCTPTATILWECLFLGMPLPPEQAQYYGYWGVMHILARSGLHIAIILMVLNMLTQRLISSRRGQMVITLSYIGWYTLISLPSISCQRALMSYLLYCVYQQAGVSWSALHILSMTTIAQITYDPFCIYTLSFQLSYSITLCIILYSRIERTSLPEQAPKKMSHIFSY